MIKEKIKEGLINHKSALYSLELNKEKLSYQRWLEKQKKDMEKADMTIEGNDSVQTSQSSVSFVTAYGGTTFRLVPYSSVNDSFKITNCIEDIIVFVNGELIDIALPLLKDKFESDSKISVVYGAEDISDFDDPSKGVYAHAIPGTEREPYFKPEWAPNAFLNHFYFGNVVAIKRSAFRDFIWNKDYEGAKCIYKNLIRFIFKNEFNVINSVGRIDEVLVHTYDESVITLPKEEIAKYISPSIVNRNEMYKISVVIPSKDNPSLIEKCIESFKALNDEKLEYEIIVVDNGSDEGNRGKLTNLSNKLGFIYIYERMDFNFARMINVGVKTSKHDNILILNDDITFTSKNTLLSMCHELDYSFTGAVGAKLLYPGSTMIQHAGVFNDRIGPVHKLQYMDDAKEYYRGFNKGVQNVSAVTGACILIKKEIYLKAGGMYEGLKVAFNDIDLCFTLLEMGYTNVVCNDVSLEHAESVTRGKDTDELSLVRLNEEKDVLYSRHPRLRGYDPYGSKNLQRDCLDVRMVAANEYEYERYIEEASKVNNVDISSFREEPCVQLSLEFADSLDKYSFTEEDDKFFFFQGFSFVSGSNNACYNKSVLLKSDTKCLAVPFAGCYRSDVETACVDQINVGLSGFCLKINKESIPSGRYRVGVLCENTCAREKLYRFSNKYLVVK